ncbi:MAG TPA: hypothetical protein VF698_01890 [Thermoanaerobaculia bacterium]|jgi:hypothetical protein
MTEQRLLDELRARASEDARTFRDKFPGQTPNERWIENSYTAALPLAKGTAGFDPGNGPHPHLFTAYSEEISRRIGGDTGREDREAAKDVVQQPTRGEG